MQKRIAECIFKGMKASKIIIVDENDRVIGSKERSRITQADTYRATGLWVTDSKGRILLAQRGLNKSHHPGKWGPAVSGTVEEDETYEENVLKEAKEELGLDNINVIEEQKKRRKGKYNYFAQWFSVVLDIDISEIKIQKEEVEQVKWFTKEELNKQVNKHPENFLKGVIERVNGEKL